MYREAQMDDGSDLGGQTDWRESVPEQYREWDEVKNSDSPDKFYEQLANQRSLIGRSIQIPTDDASPEAREAALSKVHEKFPELVRALDVSDQASVDQALKTLGKPDEAGAYQMPDIEIPEGITGLDADGIAGLKGIMFKHGLTQKQFEGLMPDLLGTDIARQTEVQASMKQNLDSVHEQWGAAYDQNIAVTVRAVEQMGFDANTVAAIRDGRMPAQNVMGYYNMAQQAGEGAPVSGQPQVNSGVMTPDEAKQRQVELMDKILNGKRDHSASNAQIGLWKKQHADLIKFAHPE